MDVVPIFMITIGIVYIFFIILLKKYSKNIEINKSKKSISIYDLLFILLTPMLLLILNGFHLFEKIVNIQTIFIILLIVYNLGKLTGKLETKTIEKPNNANPTER